MVSESAKKRSSTKINTGFLFTNVITAVDFVKRQGAPNYEIQSLEEEETKTTEVEEVTKTKKKKKKKSKSTTEETFEQALKDEEKTRKEVDKQEDKISDEIKLKVRDILIDLIYYPERNKLCQNYPVW